MCSNAYMNNTAFIAPSKIALTNMLNIADDFNLITGIIVNPNKSDLIHKKKINQLTMDMILNIKCKKEDEPVRYLGIWISEQKNDKLIKNQCYDEIFITTNRLKRKRIISQQIIYVFNAVIIPRIEYYTNLIILDKKSCDKLQVPIRKLLRHKSNISNTLPNSIL